MYVTPQIFEGVYVESSDITSYILF